MSQVNASKRDRKTLSLPRASTRWLLPSSVQSHSRLRVGQRARNPKAAAVESALARRVLGQRSATDRLIKALSRSTAGLGDPDRPLLTALLLGPSGVGKTETAKALTEGLFGRELAMTRIHCESYAHSHEMAKLLGSPPGYVGHDIEPLLSQQSLDRHHVEARRVAEESDEPCGADRLMGGECEPVSVVLFDEIEKAHPKLWSALLGILEEGVLTLGNNQEASFKRTIVLMTSNVGSRSIDEELSDGGLGFRLGERRGADRPFERQRIHEVAKEAARRMFPAEFLNRLDLQLVYRPLAAVHLSRILDGMVHRIQIRLMESVGVPLLVRLSDRARALLLERGTDARYGARPLRREVERSIVDPLSNALVAEELRAGDVVDVDVDGGAIALYRAARRSESIVA